MRIYDCFCYFDEDLLLDLRLNILADYIDYFIIVEAGEDHQGNKKKRNFDIKKFYKFKSKIKYFFLESLKIEKSFKIPQNWNLGHYRDQFQREFIMSCIEDASPDDYIIISDLDEIPNPNSILYFKNEFKYAFFKQKFFYYKFNLLNISNPYWFGSRICVKKNLKSPQWLRNINPNKQGYFKKLFDPLTILNDGGWHFSYLKKPEDIIKKINSFAHGELNFKNLQSIDIIQDKIFNKKDLFDRGYVFEAVNIDRQFPEYLIKNKTKYIEWIV